MNKYQEKGTSQQKSGTVPAPGQKQATDGQSLPLSAALPPAPAKPSGGFGKLEQAVRNANRH
jgi:hypothetical protein